ncbi:MAG: hypothetical protein VXV95_05355, partial [Candidatus Thermoplasmatota archaeon]|nr:hypothetical protein [Candidatus Thermoplasmatota archaeon]
MARESPSSNSLLSMFLVMLLIFQVSSMAISQNPTKELSQNASLSTDDDGQQMSDFSLEFGYDLAGEQLNIENIVNGMVRYETDLDIYHNEIIQSPSLGTPTVPDVVISEQQEINACWHNIEGTVNYYWADLTETFKHIQVDEVLGNGEGVNNFDCAIAVKENQRASILYTNGSDLKAGQIAYAGSMYSNGDVWHTRTILEDVGVSNVELAITPEHLEWGVFRDDNGALYRVNYTGAFWQTGL